MGSEGDPIATSRELLERMKAADAHAWNTLIDLYAPMVYRWCRTWGLPEQDAGDVLQEIFRAVSRNIEDFRKVEPRDTFRGWLRTIAHNKVRDHFRTIHRQPRAAGGTDAQRRFANLPERNRADDAETANVDTFLLRHALDEARGNFEPRTWDAFWQMAVEGRNAADVGRMLGMSSGAVRVAKARVLHRLREIMNSTQERADGPGFDS